jgi:putative ABC transport system permease protein
MIWESFKLALISLRSSKLRSFLTMLGIIIGIAAVVAINSIGEGVKKSVADQIGGLGTNIITITSGKSITTDKSGKKQTNIAASAGASTLTPADVVTVSQTKGVDGAAPIMLVSGIASVGNTTSGSALIIATTPDYNRIRSQKLESGQFFTAAQSTAKVVVLTDAAKVSLFADTDALGKTVLIRGTKFTVVGIIAAPDTSASAISGADPTENSIYMPLEAGKALAGGNVQIMRILAQATSADEVKPTVVRINAALLKNHSGQEDFSVLTQADLLDTVSGILNLLSTFIAAIASIALLVGGIGIMNMMLVTVTERTREIGIRKALGATRGNILLQFLIEAITLSLFGGVLGIAAAYGMGRIAGKIAKITPVFTPQVIALAFGISVTIGIVFGLAPAIQAARKRPIQALKYE